ncbi:MAG: hypothetical protein QOG91_577 [Candidatus Parcubacteria bacterium]|nr:hypothetical protein [Candidatus Parcubacteria bacterium]
MKSFSQKNRGILRGRRDGFTLIESLVAITILMIAIAGPLTVASKAYHAALDARDQTIAGNLAAEGLEYINNLKDNDLANNTWPPAAATCIETALCGISLPADWGAVSPVFLPCSNPAMNGCTLWISDSHGYTYDPTAGSASPFMRTFYLTPAPAGSQYLATVVVSWTAGSFGNQVQLQELLSNYDNNER